METEEEAKSESNENIAISRYQVAENEEEPNVQERIVTKLEVHVDSRLEEYFAFGVDDVFIQ